MDLVPCDVIILNKVNKIVKSDIFIDVISRNIHSVTLDSKSLRTFDFFDLLQFIHTNLMGDFDLRKVLKYYL